MALFAPGGVLAPLALADVRLPQLYKLDELHHLLLMEDLGPWPNLGEWLKAPHPPQAAAAIGKLLGQFIGALHRVSAHRPELAHSFNNQNIQRTRLEFQYRNVQAYAQRAGLPEAEALGRRAIHYGEDYSSQASVW